MKTLYSQFELLGLAYSRCKRSNQDAIVGEIARYSKPNRRADHEPTLPTGYVHIRSAVQALLALARPPDYIKPGGRFRAIRAA